MTRRRLTIVGRTVAALTTLALSVHAGPLVRTDTAAPGAGQVLDELAAGMTQRAAESAWQLVRESPADPVAQEVAGAASLQASDYGAAVDRFSAALRLASDDTLAQYGLALAFLARGNVARAESLLASCRANGDGATAVTLALRYMALLGGAAVNVDGLPVPRTLEGSRDALAGMARMRSGRAASGTGISLLMRAADSGADPVQSIGVLMSFDPRAPVRGSTHAPGLVGREAAATAVQMVSGVVQIGPTGSPAGAQYASFVLDGRAIGLVNVRPYQLAWDSRRVSNGQHRLDVVFYDTDGKEAGRSETVLRVLNAGSAREDSDGDVRSRVWRAITLQPDRAACAYIAGDAAARAGARAESRRAFALAAAIDPAYRDVRMRMLQAGGASGASPALWGGLNTEKVVALTFDDGPKPGITEALVRFLQREQVPATFFVVGKNVVKYPELTRSIADAGFEIANHTYSHRNLAKLPAREAAREILRAQVVIEDATGRLPRFIRPPGGDWSDAMSRLAAAWGMTPCMWTVDAYGSEIISAQQVASAVLRQVQPGSIILMHNGKVTTLEALPTILAELRRRGYRFETVGTMAYRLNYAKAAVRLASERAGRYAARHPEW